MSNLYLIGKEFNVHSGANTTIENGLKRAQLELTEAMEETDPQKQLIEMADIVLVLAAVCASAELDLDGAIEYKHELNMSRKWEPHPDIPGAVRRVK